MARVAVALTCTAETCTAEQRGELLALARSRTKEARLVERAKIVLGSPGGQTERCGWPRVWRAAEYGGSVAQAVCGSWAGRAAGSGAAGQDRQIWRGFAPMGSAPIGIAAAQGVGQLGRASLAAALGASDDAVWRLLRREGVQLRRRRSWCVSADPQFAAKPAPGPHRGTPILSAST